jgi:hypothetical protein
MARDGCLAAPRLLVRASPLGRPFRPAGVCPSVQAGWGLSVTLSPSSVILVPRSRNRLVCPVGRLVSFPPSLHPSSQSNDGPGSVLTMSSRIEKQHSKKSSQRLRLSALIASSGHILDMPCSSCFEKGVPCQMMEGVTRCAECVRRGRSCDGLGVPFNASGWSRWL